jgi:hypothetical protein
VRLPKKIEKDEFNSGSSSFAPLLRLSCPAPCALFGRYAMVRFRFAATAAFLTFRRTGARCLALAV